MGLNDGIAMSYPTDNLAKNFDWEKSVGRRVALNVTIKTKTRIFQVVV